MDHCSHSESGCKSSSNKIDYIFWISLIISALSYLLFLFAHSQIIDIPYLGTFSKAVYELFNQMWFGLLIGIFFISLLGVVPKEAVMSILGTDKGLKGILRATLAGVLLDLCSHGILMVGAKLYERGANTGQVMAFLIASPWNSISLTFILISLIGLKWTLMFIVLSVLIAIVSGLIFNQLVKNKTLPENPNQLEIPENFNLSASLKSTFSKDFFQLNNLKKVFGNGLKESRMVVRWLLFGLVIAAVMRALIPQDAFQTYFGKSLLGLTLTIIAATIIEVCSEGSVPIAADILNRAHALGNAFAFMMTGVSTDYSEVLILREATKSWKIALFLPLITFPQVLIISLILNFIH